MDTTLIATPYEVFQTEIQPKFYIVQYDKGNNIFVRKITRSQDIVENKKVPPHQNVEAEPVLVRDEDQLFLGYVIYIATTELDAFEKVNSLQDICKKVLHDPRGYTDIANKMYFNSNFWVLVMYTVKTTAAMNGEQYQFGIFNKNDVLLKTEKHAYEYIVYIQQNFITHKGVVLKAGNNLFQLSATMDFLKYVPIKTLLINLKTEEEKKMQQVLEVLKPMEHKMLSDIQMLVRAYRTLNLAHHKKQFRLLYLKNLAKSHNIQT